MLHEAVEAVARSAPDASAVITADRTVSFADLGCRIDAARAFIAARTAIGERVAVIGDNDLPWIDAYYGVPAVGRVLVFLNHRLAPSELVAMIRRARVRLVVGPDAFLGSIREAWGTVAEGGGVLPATVSFADWEVAIASPDPSVASTDIDDERAARRDDDVAWLLFSSGTTAEPKGVLLAHRDLLAATTATDAARPVADDDVYVFPFPLCHIAGYGVVRHLARGRPVVLLPRFEPAAFVAAVAEHRGTTTSLAATMLATLLDHVDASPDAHEQLASLRSIQYGAAPMPAPLLRRADAVLGVEFAQGYGMTELAGNAVFLSPEAHRRGLAGDERLLRSAGWPAPGVEVRVVDDGGRDVGAGTAGEILVRAEQTMVGYLDAPEATAEALVDGWLHTGDIGHLAADGLLTVVDRKKDLIVTGGENVSSLEVEAVMRDLPAVAEVAVVGVPDPTWGENVCAVVVPAPDEPFDADAVVAELRTRIAGFKIPRHVVVVDLLPVNATGKVMKQELRARFVENPMQLGPRR